MVQVTLDLDHAQGKFEHREKNSVYQLSYIHYYIQLLMTSLILV